MYSDFLRRLWSRSKTDHSQPRFQGLANEYEDTIEIGNVHSRSVGSASNTLSSLTLSNTIDKSVTAKYSIVEQNNASPTEFHFGAEDNEEISKNIFSQRGQNWIKSVRLCAIGSAVVLLLNIVFMATAAGIARRHSGHSTFSSAEVMYEGNCEKVQRWDMAIHFIINVLSTCILAASNYCMQTLAAPTRQQVDRYHVQGKWLDIGTASLKNLLAIDRYQLSLWIILAVTATPFHLLYNSMTFQSWSMNDSCGAVGPSYLNSSNVLDLSTAVLEQCFFCREAGKTESLRWSTIAGDIEDGNYDIWSSLECRNWVDGKSKMGYKAIIALADNLDTVYATDPSATSSDTILASPYQNTSDKATISCQDPVGDLSYYYGQSQAYYSGLIPFWPDVDIIPKNYTYHQCLAVRAEQHCQLIYSPAICIAVAIAAFAKVVTMFLAAHLGQSRAPPLLTIGDAVASFMADPDPTTRNMSGMSVSDVHEGIWKETVANVTPIAPNKLSKRKFWFQVPGRMRWIPAFIMCFCTIAAGIYFVANANIFDLNATTSFEELPTSSTTGTIEQKLFGLYHIVTLKHPLTVLGAVALANTPQILTTLSYYCYNAVLTSMLAASEFSSFGVKRKSLRVSWPVKGSTQRSTHWLSVPYSYAVPVLVIYAVLHWMISQSLFYLVLTEYDILGHRQGNLSSSEDLSAVGTGAVNRLGYSPLPMLIAISVGGLMVLLVLGLGLMRLKSPMPLAGSCSAVISAACHPPNDEPADAPYGPLKWGEPLSISPEGFTTELEGTIGHCSFTSQGIVKPSLTKLYA